MSIHRNEEQSDFVLLWISHQTLRFVHDGSVPRVFIHRLQIAKFLVISADRKLFVVLLNKLATLTVGKVSWCVTVGLLPVSQRK